MRCPKRRHGGADLHSSRALRSNSCRTASRDRLRSRMSARVAHSSLVIRSFMVKRIVSTAHSSGNNQPQE